MDSSPLVKAHDHALAASKATKSSDTTVAISHHALAAGEFANAAQSTTSIEALRTLNLLEQHHRRLSELLKFPADQPSQAPSDADADVDEKQSSGLSKEASITGDATPKTDKIGGGLKAPAQVPSLLGQRRQPPRELSSSIASNLASARGIRVKYSGQPLSPSVSSDPASGAVEALPRRRDGSRSKMQNMLDQPPKPVWTAPGPGSAQEHQAQRSQRDAETLRGAAASPGGSEQAEDGYSRFYNSFGSLFSKLSAPLAFAGLPLIAEEASASQEALAPPPEPTSPKRSRSRHHGQHHGAPTTAATTVSATGEPDLNRIYSKAALRVISRDGHYQASDSFYVVPPSGHTMSYASILSFAEKEKRRMEASSHSHSHAVGPDNDEDDFVDARETPLPSPAAAATSNLSAVARRRIGPRARTERDLNNAIEELVVENKSLKDMLDKLSKRLHAFEASAQKSSLALAESMRFMRPGSPLASATSGSGGSAGGTGGTVNAEMEEKLAAAMRRVEALEKDNQKMQKTLVKYRDKWEQLKETAKARRGQAGSGNGNGGGEPAG